MTREEITQYVIDTLIKKHPDKFDLSRNGTLRYGCDIVIRYDGDINWSAWNRRYLTGKFSWCEFDSLTFDKVHLTTDNYKKFINVVDRFFKENED